MLLKWLLVVNATIRETQLAVCGTTLRYASLIITGTFVIFNILSYLFIYLFIY